MTRHQALLRAAAWLVPRPERTHWLEEWESELWYVENRATLFCLGAFRDAFWVRRTAGGVRFPPFRIVSPWRCLGALAAMAAVSIFFAFRLALPRAVLLPSPVPGARSLAIVSGIGHHYVEQPAMLLDQYRALSNHLGSRFTGLAFYQTRHATFGTLAVSTDNIFDLLGNPIAGGPGERLVVRRALWKKRFHSDPHIVGRSIDVAGHPATIAAVVPDFAVELPGKPDAWLLQDAPPFTADRGFVLARLRAPASQWKWSFAVEGQRIECSSLAHENLLALFFLVGLMSLVIVSLTAPLTLGEYPSVHSWQRWGFFLLKIVLVQVIACCGSLDLASVLQPALQPHGLLIGLIVALRWALADQRQRCPVCLRLLSNPTRIGGPSHIFLDWYGTELMCSHGHGLLYVPEIPTSSYSTQRWQHLDASWSTLFS